MKKRFQDRVREWVDHCFGTKIADNKNERNERFLEESLELVQSAGMTEDQVKRLVTYVFSRPPGELKQEVGGVAVTFDALCSAHRLDRERCAEIELERIHGLSDEIREKQRSKPSLGKKSSVYPERA